MVSATLAWAASFLTTYLDENGKPKYYGRFNQGVVTINLVDVACSSYKDMDKFWKIFDERLEFADVRLCSVTKDLKALRQTLRLSFGRTVH